MVYLCDLRNFLILQSWVFKMPLFHTDGNPRSIIYIVLFHLRNTSIYFVRLRKMCIVDYLND